MRILALYDVHGNDDALAAVLADPRAADPDAVVVGGDTVPGPFALEALARLDALAVPVHRVRGNGEREVAEAAAGDPIDETAALTRGGARARAGGAPRRAAADRHDRRRPLLPRDPAQRRRDPHPALDGRPLDGGLRRRRRAPRRRRPRTSRTTAGSVTCGSSTPGASACRTRATARPGGCGSPTASRNSGRPRTTPRRPDAGCSTPVGPTTAPSGPRCSSRSRPTSSRACSRSGPRLTRIGPGARSFADGAQPRAGPRRPPVRDARPPRAGRASARGRPCGARPLRPHRRAGDAARPRAPHDLPRPGGGGHLRPARDPPRGPHARDRGVGDGLAAGAARGHRPRRARAGRRPRRHARGARPCRWDAGAEGLRAPAPAGGPCGRRALRGRAGARDRTAPGRAARARARVDAAGRVRPPARRHPHVGGDGGLDRAGRRDRAAVGDGGIPRARGRGPQPPTRHRALRRSRRRDGRGRARRGVGRDPRARARPGGRRPAPRGPRAGDRGVRGRCGAGDRRGRLRVGLSPLRPRGDARGVRRPAARARAPRGISRRVRRPRRAAGRRGRSARGARPPAAHPATGPARRGAGSPRCASAGATTPAACSTGSPARCKPWAERPPARRVASRTDGMAAGARDDSASLSAMLGILDGSVLPAEQIQIPATDEGLLRGDGVFEVMRLYDGRPFAVDDHLERMARSAANLLLPFDGAAVRADIDALLEAARPEGDGVVRVLVTRGGRRIGFLEPFPRCPTRSRSDDHLLADAHPRRRQVAVLRGEHARDADGRGRGRRRGAARHAARARPRGADLVVLLLARRRARS